MCGKRIKTLRSILGMTTEKVAQCLQISTEDLCNYENDVRPLPANLIIRLCLLYRCTADYILGLAPSPSCDMADNELLTIYRSLDDVSKGMLFEKAVYLRETQGPIYIVSQLILSLQHAMEMLSMGNLKTKFEVN